METFSQVISAIDLAESAGVLTIGGLLTALITWIRRNLTVEVKELDIHIRNKQKKPISYRKVTKLNPKKGPGGIHRDNSDKT